MAIYRFRHEKTGDEVDHWCSFDEYEELKEGLEAEGWHRVLTPLNIVSGSPSIGKIDNGFNDVLMKIKSGSGRSNTIRTK